MDRPDTAGNGVMEPRTAVNRAALAVSVALLPAWSLSFAESTVGLPLFAVLTVSILTVGITIDRPIIRPVRLRSASVLLFLVLPFAGVVSLVINPSGAGAILVVSMVAVVGIAAAIAGIPVDDVRTFVAAPFLVTASIQSVIVVVQSLTDTAFGYSLLHSGAELLVTDGYARPQGLFDHVYEAAIVALLAIGIGLALLPDRGRMRTWFLVGIGLSSASVALTHSRSALFGLVLVVVIGGAAAARKAPTLRSGIAVTLIAFAIPALMTASVWEARLTETVTGSIDDASSGRISLMKQALNLAEGHPFVGVGPNRYMDALEATVDTSEVEFVVHNIPLMVTAELGIPAGIAFTALLIWTGVQAVSCGYRTSILFFAPVPFMLFDVIMYNRPLGLLLFAIWAGTLAAMRAAQEATRTKEPIDAHHR